MAISVVSDSCHDAKVWPASPAIRSRLMLVMPAARRRLQVGRNHCPVVKAPALVRLAIDKRLHTEADTIHTQSRDCLQGGIGKLAGSALHGDLCIRIDGEFRSNGGEELLQ